MEDFNLAALFLWMMFCLAALSIAVKALLIVFNSFLALADLMRLL